MSPATEELKARLDVLVEKEGSDTYCQLLLELVLQLAKLNENLENGIVFYEGGEAEEVED
ncbi:MAG: hypothetical protein ACE5FB_01330 [Candidatus Binatia bacterium]